MAIGQKIAGSFYVTAKRVAGGTKPRVLVNLSADGGFMHSDQNDFSEHQLTSPAYGSWQHDEDLRLIARSVAIVASGQGSALGLQQWRWVLTFEPSYNQFTIDKVSYASLKPDDDPTVDPPEGWKDIPGTAEGNRIRPLLKPIPWT